MGIVYPYLTADRQKQNKNSLSHILPGKTWNYLAGNSIPVNTRHMGCVKYFSRPTYDSHDYLFEYRTNSKDSFVLHVPRFINEVICSCHCHPLLSTRYMAVPVKALYLGVPKAVKSGDDEHHDDVIKWKHFPRYWPFVRGIHRLPVNSPHRGQWCGTLIFPLICAWINGWVNKGEAGDWRRHSTHYDVTAMVSW